MKRGKNKKIKRVSRKIEGLIVETDQFEDIWAYTPSPVRLRAQFKLGNEYYYKNHTGYVIDGEHKGLHYTYYTRGHEKK